MYKPRLGDVHTTRELISRFKGYENNLSIEENAFSFTKNMGSDAYPALSPRNRRSFFNVFGDKLQCLCSKEHICYINNGSLYYGGKKFVGLNFPDISGERKYVSMGAKLLIFPDKVYINTEDTSDYGSLEAHFESSDGAVCGICKADGDFYEGYQVSGTAPADPKNGDLWLDTSTYPHTLKQYSEVIASWIELSETYIRINCVGIGKPFNVHDAVRLLGFKGVGITGKHIIRDKGDDYIVITGIIDGRVQIHGEVSVHRTIPDMDFVCENSNRIWGCSSKRNEIYASKLGDPTNFDVFMGISTDSYAASIGTDGPFTGAVSYRGYILFFKENCVHKIYGQNPPYTIITSYIRGVQKGCHRSIVCLNETLYYKSPGGVCAYEGGVPVCISQALGKEFYSEAVAGACGNKYYICMSDKHGVRHLFVYDEDKALWHREDNIDIREFSQNNYNLYFIMKTDNTKRLGLIDGENRYGSFTGELTGFVEEGDFEWCTESGIWGLSLPENKYYSDVVFRAVGEKGARLKIYFEFNSNGKWIKQMDRCFEKTGSVMLPFITPRCDHIRVKVEGKGYIKIYSLARRIESGSDLNV